MAAAAAAEMFMGSEVPEGLLLELDEVDGEEAALTAGASFKSCSGAVPRARARGGRPRVAGPRRRSHARGAVRAGVAEGGGAHSE
eukprot:312233-Pyramimonas_sp.AAC.1